MEYLGGVSEAEEHEERKGHGYVKECNPKVLADACLFGQLVDLAPDNVGGWVRLVHLPFLNTELHNLLVLHQILFHKFNFVNGLVNTVFVFK